MVTRQPCQGYESKLEVVALPMTNDYIKRLSYRRPLLYPYNQLSTDIDKNYFYLEEDLEGIMIK